MVSKIFASLYRNGTFMDDWKPNQRADSQRKDLRTTRNWVYVLG